MAEFTTVFLSSTTKDLQPWRDAVFDAIGKMAGLHCVRMEDFGPIDAAPLEVCQRKVAEADLFIGLVGHFFGSRPEGSELSCTQVEYEEAKRRKKPRLMFLADEDFPVPPRLGRESEDSYQRQLAFRAQVQRERTVVTFHEPDKLATTVVAALQSHLEQARSGTGRTAERKSKGPTKVSNALAVGAGAVAASSGGIAAGRDVHIVQHTASPGELDDSALVEAYLGHLIGKIEHLTLQGIDPAVKDAGHDPRLKLNGVYTALRTHSFEERSGPSEKAKAPDLERTEEKRLLSALELLDRESRLVVLGDPGSGKSTFVNFVALCLAGERLGREDLNLKLLNATEADPEDDDEDDDGPAWPERTPPRAPAWNRGSLLPVRFVLRDFAAKGDLPKPGVPAQASALWDFLRSELKDCGHPELFPYLRQELLAGRCLVLFDGLDEVPEARDRRHQILQAVEAWSSGIRKSRVLVTSRTYAYQKQEWKLNGFAEATLAPFSRGQIERFVGLWYEQMVALGRFAAGEAHGRAELLRRAIFGSDRLLALAERPLLLTLTASLHAWRGGVLPDRREELYRDAVELLLDTWERRRIQLNEESSGLLHEPSLAEWLRVDRQEVRQVLEELAFEAHRAQADLTGTADVAEGDLVARLLHLRRNPDAHPGQLVAYLRDRSGILVERGNGVFTFPHRTFQEYLAACHLVAAWDSEEIAELAKSEPGRWREVVLLAGAKAGLWGLAEALCHREPEEVENDSAEDWGALMAGQMVAESANLGRIGKANGKKLERIRFWLVQLLGRESFPALERAAAGRALAVLGDPRFDPDTWSFLKEADLGFIRVPEGSFTMGSAEDDPDTAERERPQFALRLPTFWMARFPVTVAQFRAFVENSGHEPLDSRCLDGTTNAPVVLITWLDALAYCRWLGDKLVEVSARRDDDGPFWAAIRNGTLRPCLPSEAEWEKAARGLSGWVFPWGDEAEPNRANFLDIGLAQPNSVGAFPGGKSVFGCEEMCGNVWEWTRNFWGGNFLEPLFGYPYRIGDGREGLEPTLDNPRVVRGGSFHNVDWSVRCAVRYSFDPDIPSNDIGFRVVLSTFSSKLKLSKNFRR